uniref:Uncharacterized protein n=1 Tax=Oryza punctata TaxID=4537 RepID=A0A0E0MG29_ORYPU
MRAELYLVRSEYHHLITLAKLVILLLRFNYKSFDFFLSQTYLSLIKFIEKYSSIFSRKQTYYQNIFNVRFNDINLIF